MMHGLPYEQLPVTFDEVQFVRATSLVKNQDVTLSISIHKSKKIV